MTLANFDLELEVLEPYTVTALSEVYSVELIYRDIGLLDIGLP